MFRSPQRRLFRLTGWVAAYAVALQALLFAYAGAFAAQQVPAGAAGAAILCLTGELSPEGAGSDAHGLRDHCAACFAAAAALPPPERAASPVRYATFQAPEPAQAATMPRRPPLGLPGLPRAPPFPA